MYGLMKARSCSHHPQEARNRRLHYCGTCKTMGRLYGQKARFLLNNDAVFLGELLTALSPDTQPLAAWNRAYQSYNCLALPATAEEMPLSLQVAATATLVMSEFKVTDQIEDASHSGWKLAMRVFSQSFYDAAARMKAWDFPVAEMWNWYQAQNVREKEVQEAKGSRSAQEVLAYVAEPTATVTGLVFQHGGALVGCAPETQTTLFELGFAFGKLVYVLDALEDYQKDAKHRDFNALRVAFSLPGETLPDAYYEMTADGLEEIAAQIETALNALPLPREQAAKFAARLQANLVRKIGEPVDGAEPMEETAPVCAVAPVKTRLSFRARGKSAVSLARTIAARQRETKPALLAALLTPFVLASVFLVALVFPRQALAATTYRECLDIPLNLMFWGAVLQSLRPQRLQPAFRPASAGESGSRLILQSNDAPGSGNENPGTSSGAPGTRGIPRSQSRRLRRARGERVGGCCCADLDCCDWCCIFEYCGGDECCCECCSAGCDGCSGGCDCCSGGCDCCSGCDCSC